MTTTPMTVPPMTMPPVTKTPMSQWDCIRANLGQWQGSFTNLSPQGQILCDTPSVLVLQELDAQTIQLTLTRTPAGEAPSERCLSFCHPGPGAAIPFLETGAFSQGSLFWSSYGQAGAELALTTPDRRLRAVFLYEGSTADPSHLTELTLIRETRAGTQALPSPDLTIEALLGTWQGQSITTFADGSQSAASPTHLVLERQGDRLHQALTFSPSTSSSPGQPSQTIATSARIATTTADRPCLHFDQGLQPITILLLPNGASCTFPSPVTPRQPFFLELGWLLGPNQRQRLIRRYNDKGDWLSLTLVQEQRLS
jgi:hypothetical protein